MVQCAVLCELARFEKKLDGSCCEISGMDKLQLLFRFPHGYIYVYYTVSNVYNTFHNGNYHCF